jgi:hypothetical protein
MDIYNTSNIVTPEVGLVQRYGGVVSLANEYQMILPKMWEIEDPQHSGNSYDSQMSSFERRETYPLRESVNTTWFDVIRHASPSRKCELSSA